VTKSILFEASANRVQEYSFEWLPIDREGESVVKWPLQETCHLQPEKDRHEPQLILRLRISTRGCHADRKCDVDSYSWDNFSSSIDLVVRFEVNEYLSATVIPYFESTQALVATVPPNPSGTAGSAIAEIQVSNINFDFLATGIQYDWDRSVLVHSITPEVVFESASSVVTVHGAGFIPRFPNMLKCCF
jgi:hypothetical protein